MFSSQSFKTYALYFFDPFAENKQTNKKPILVRLKLNILQDQKIFHSFPQTQVKSQGNKSLKPAPLFQCNHAF